MIENFAVRALPPRGVAVSTYLAALSGLPDTRPVKRSRVVPAFSALELVLPILTARVHGLQVVTRNAKDFKEFGVDIVNPYAPR